MSLNFTKYSLHLPLYFQGLQVKIRDVNSLQMLTLTGLKSTLVNGENRTLNSGLSTMLCLVRQSNVSNPAAARPQPVILWQQQLIRTWAYSRLGNKVVCYCGSQPAGLCPRWQQQRHRYIIRPVICPSDMNVQANRKFIVATSDNEFLWA